MAFRMKGWSGFTKATDNKMKRADSAADRKADMKTAAKTAAQAGVEMGGTADALRESIKRQPGSMKFQKDLKKGIKDYRAEGIKREEYEPPKKPAQSSENPNTGKAAPLTLQGNVDKKSMRREKRSLRKLPKMEDSTAKTDRKMKKWEKHMEKQMSRSTAGDDRKAARENRRMEREMSKSTAKGEDRKVRRASRKTKKDFSKNIQDPTKSRNRKWVNPDAPGGIYDQQKAANKKEGSPMKLKKFAKKAIGATPIGMLANKLKRGGKAKRARGQAQAQTAATGAQGVMGGSAGNMAQDAMAGGAMSRAQGMQAAPLREAAPFNMPQPKTKFPRGLGERKDTTTPKKRKSAPKLIDRTKRKGGLISSEESNKRTMERWNEKARTGPPKPIIKRGEARTKKRK